MLNLEHPLLIGRIGLGTVQLGLGYGNHPNPPTRETAFEVLDAAVDAGVRFFDTAPDYGDSEEILGQYRLGDVAGVQIATKIPARERAVWADASRFEAEVISRVAASCRRLRVSRVALVQFHQSDADFLQCAPLAGLVARLLDTTCDAVGVSAYTMNEAQLALQIPGVTALQLPVNLVDTRALGEPWLATCRNRGIHIIARSVFLQGVLVESAALPPVQRANELAELRALLEPVRVRANQSLEQVAISWVLERLSTVRSTALLGATNAAMLQHNLRMLDNKLSVPLEHLEEWLAPARAFAVERGLVHPGTWLARR